MFIGLLFVGGGVVWLLSNLGIISANVSDIIWPIVVIVVGVKLLMKRSGHSCGWCSVSNKENKQE